MCQDIQNRKISLERLKFETGAPRLSRRILLELPAGSNAERGVANDSERLRVSPSEAPEGYSLRI